MKYKHKPDKCGWYWIINQHTLDPARMVKVWKNSSGTDKRLFTNEDGGATVEDEMYKNYRWCGPLKEPRYTQD